MAAAFPPSESPGLTDVQPLPARPGAQAVRPKGKVTAGRPLPPRSVDRAAATAATAPADAEPELPAQPVAATAIVAAPPPQPRPEASRPARPDPRSMRVALGAGAVAAMSVMAVGFVQPDFGATADQPIEADEVAAAAVPADAGPDVRVRVRHVTRYVFLDPGQRAPRGATVISPERADQRSRARTRRAAARSNPPSARSNTTRTRKPAPEAARPSEPRAQQPRTTTRQSG